MTTVPFYKYIFDLRIDLFVCRRFELSRHHRMQHYKFVWCSRVFVHRTIHICVYWYERCEIVSGQYGRWRMVQDYGWGHRLIYLLTCTWISIWFFFCSSSRCSCISWHLNKSSRLDDTGCLPSCEHLFIPFEDNIKYILKFMNENSNAKRSYKSHEVFSSFSISHKICHEPRTRAPPPSRKRQFQILKNVKQKMWIFILIETM